MNAGALLLALASATANAFATLSLRQAAFAPPLLARLQIPMSSQSVSDWYLVALISYAAAFVLYAAALARLPASVAYPVIVGLAYLMIAVAASVLFAERLTTLQWIGGVLVAIGIALISLAPARQGAV